ncbi:MEMBRANE PROTEIN OF ER BODY-LIKE PROTEIN [Salix purpurea]|uniref:MEMBRANE PROTEIN OF ER BODY-LIKE PROTEIN n=1 Tax=Salix purpurea TaxID=77065 RepID=A0A9Q1ALR7_SALPP|nr:MEMBRANE PROTEIN OF ER BODY-LIKE PROTEIN [Salix purpurea]
MASPTSSLLGQIPMENQKQKLVPEEEEEEVLSLQSSQFQHCSSSDDGSSSDDVNKTCANTALLVDIVSTSGNENGTGTGISSLICSSSINEDSEIPKVGVSSPCAVSPHKHWGGGDKDTDENEEKAHHLNSVYFDQHHGIWKCHHCNWTYCAGTPCFDHKECSHTHTQTHSLINLINLNQQQPCLVFGTKGADSINGASGVNYGGATCSVLDTSPRHAEVLVKNSEIPKSLVKDVNLQLGENMDNEGSSGSSLTPLEDTFEEQNFKSKPPDSETRVIGDLDLIEEIEQEMTEFDVEKVLEKQNTHDLYCPNCNSCITRRVILRKRRWKNRNARRKPKHAKVDTTVPSELNGNSTYSDASSADSASDPGHDIANICSNDSPKPAVDDHNCDREPDVFRCLSCFSLFIPAGNGFKLFRVSSTENEKVQDPQKISTATTNWFFSIFATHKRKTTTEHGNAAVDHTQVHGMNQDASSGFPNNFSSSNGNDHSVMPHAEKTLVKTGEHPEGSYSKPHQSGAGSLNPSTMEPLLLDQSPQGINLKSNLTNRNGILADQNTPLLSVDIASVESSSIAGIVNNMGGASLKGGKGILSSSRETKFTETALISAREKSGDAAGNSDGSLMNHAIMDTAQQLPYSLGSMEGLKENAPFRPGQGLLNCLEYSTPKSLIPEQSEIQIDEKFNMAKENKKPLQNGQASSAQGTSLPSQLDSKGGFINAAALKHHEGGRVALNSLSQGTLWPETEKISTGENEVNAAENKNIGNNVIITIAKESPKRGDSEIVCIDSVEPTSLLNSSNQTNVGERKGAEVGESRKLEILKSIVYGGLIESITSLGVVSSAAGASAGTLNIIALGLANLIGGLFIIGHNLMDLKNDHSNKVNEQEDRYQETLGRRDNFSLHATLSILSFLIFGLLPPVVYGFSFRKSDDRDLKLAAVGGASFLHHIACYREGPHSEETTQAIHQHCIILLFAPGLWPQGASYLVGDLISKLFAEK